MAWTLAAVGDVMLSEALGSSRAFAMLRDADLAFANLEVPLSRRGHPADKPIAFRADPSLAAELARIGLDVVSFANNHSLDYGTDALLDTLSAVEEAGVVVVGAGENLESSLRPRVLHAGDSRVAFLAFASTLPTGSAAAPDRPGVAPLRVEVAVLADAPVFEEQPGTSPYVRTTALEDDLGQARRAIAAARGQADAVVVSVHWGVPPGWAAPFQGILADYQQPLGHALVDAGADLVLGHHPHTLHGIEIYRGRFICYSLGNFIFHSLAAGKPLTLGRPSPPYRLQYVRPPELEESALFTFTYGRGRWGLEIIPCAFDERGECRPVDGQRGQRILERLAGHCEGLGVELAVTGASRGVVTAPA